MPVETPGRVYSEEALVQQLSLNNSAATGYLYDLYAPAIYSIAIKHLKEDLKAQKILEELFVQLPLQFPAYSARQQRLFTWLLTRFKQLLLKEHPFTDDVVDQNFFSDKRSAVEIRRQNNTHVLANFYKLSAEQISKLLINHALP